MRTTIGDVDESLLARTMGFEDRPDKYVVWVEWKHLDTQLGSFEVVRRDAFPLLKEIAPFVHTTEGELPIADLERVIELRDQEDQMVVSVYWFYRLRSVRKDVHVIKKFASETATAIAGGM